MWEMAAWRQLPRPVFLVASTIVFPLAAPSHATDLAPDRSSDVTFVGREVCGSCHQAELERWRGSHHDLAMQEATASSVLGDFNNASITHFGTTSSFSRANGGFFVRTDGPDGQLHDYEIAYTFGVHPLQQYLIAFPGGRLQALGLAWDSRPAAEGGQRWFHLYPDEEVPAGDPLHWTGPNQTWNYMCADCHSTDLRKNHDLATNSYLTTWSEIDVSCEACHGPGSRHVAWAKAPDGTAADHTQGLPVSFRDPGGGGWELEPNSATARRSAPRQSIAELETCARCHARRSEIALSYSYGHPFLDTHRPALLDAGLYHADGQILDEVYEYGSFLQSRMFQAGVTCSDCHDPHSLRLRAEGNAVCGQCHRPAVFDTEAHHHHKAGSAGAQCAECHMPARTYMVIDARRDHAIRIPRPDLSIAIGTPNACNGCHADQTAEWAAAAVERWHGPNRRAEPHYGSVIDAGRQGKPGADAALSDLVLDGGKPAIVRATALSLLPQFTANVTPEMIKAYLAGVGDADPLVRTAAVDALAPFAPEERLPVIAPLLTDPVRAVRIATARLLAAVPTQLLTTQQRMELEKASAEFIDAQMASADRPEAHVTLGAFHADRAQTDAAEAAYRTALRLDPSFVPAMVNLADLYRALRRDAEGEPLLRQAVATEPQNAVAHHALGLLLLRRQQLDAAITELREAARLAPNNARHAYVYAIALHAAGQSAEALRVLRYDQQMHPADVDVLIALVTISRDTGDLAAAKDYAEQLLRLAPDNPDARALYQSLGPPQ
jgi:Flp pilus assembly protein TadD